MSRTTQYIGLTDDAKKWVDDCTGSESFTLVNAGMFGEDVRVTCYYMPAPKGPNKYLIAKEMCQIAPWSSGPMLFTCLKLTLVKEGGQEVDMGEAFQWVYNPGLEGEYDPVKGHYNV